MDFVTRNFNLKCQKYARKGLIHRLENLSRKLPVQKWGKRVDSNAAKSGRLDVIRWLDEKGYKMDWKEVALNANLSTRLLNSLEIVKLSQSRCGKCIDTYFLCVVIEHGRIDILHAFPSFPFAQFTVILTSTAVNCDQPVILQWLLEKKCPTTINAYYISIARVMETNAKGSNLMLELLHRFKAPGDWKCQRGDQENCRYCQIEKSEKVWKEWEMENATESIQYDSLLMWPPEEVMEDLLEFLRI
jgi:hypothetical protein